MKLIITSTACLLLAGCATVLSTNTLTQLDDGKVVNVTVGQVLTVELPGNRTTGYSWSEPAASETVLERLGEPAYMTNPAPSGMVGVGGKEVWRFRAAKAGRQTLRLEYTRPWEKNVAPAKVVTFNVVVSER